MSVERGVPEYLRLNLCIMGGEESSVISQKSLCCAPYLERVGVEEKRSCDEVRLVVFVALNTSSD